LGRVGCLTEGTIDNYKEKINEILNNNYYIEERNTIECKVMNGDVVKSQGHAFNEVSLQRAKFYKMMLISMLVNGRNLTSFYSDGVVVATPTGSSAFSLSCGGPLLLPTARNFVITPISPQLRTITSLVVNDTDIISLDLSKEKERGRDEDDKAAIVIDGYELIEVSSDDKILIKKSEKKLRIIKVEKEASLFEPTFKVALSSQNIKQ
jgi:NAD+ kinase